MTGRYGTEWLPAVALANAVRVLDMAQHCALLLGPGAGGEAGWYSPGDDLDTAQRIDDDALTTVTVLLNCHALTLGERFTHIDSDGERVFRDLVLITHTGRDLYFNLTGVHGN